MGSFCEFVTDVFRSAIIVPFTAGRITHRSDPRDADGSLASVVTIACMTAIMFVFISVYGVNRNTDPNAEPVIWALLMTLIIFALLSFILISVLAYRNKDHWYDPRTVQINGSSQIKVKFLWLFGFGVIFETALDLAVNIDCLPEKDLQADWSFDIFGNVSAIFYFCLQMGFISYFKHYNFSGCTRVNYGILLILLTNLSLWFNSVLSEQNHKTNNTSSKAYLSNSTNTCRGYSEMSHYRDIITPYLAPVRVEFFLLGTGFMLGMWPSIKNSTTRLFEASEETVEYSAELIDERTALLRYRGDNNQNQSAATSQRHPVSVYLAIVFGIVLNLPLLISNSVLIFVFKTVKMFVAWEATVIVYKTTMLIMILIIFRQLSKAESKEKTLSTNDYILIFSTSGTVSVCTFSFLAGMYIGTAEGIVVLVDSFIDLIGTYLQTILILLAERKHQITHSKSILATDYMFLFLAFSNWVFWTLDSFVNVYHNEPLQIQMKYFGDWKMELGKEILSPILIFYRFHSSMDLYGLFCRYKSRALR